MSDEEANSRAVHRAQVMRLKGVQNELDSVIRDLIPERRDIAIAELKGVLRKIHFVQKMLEVKS